ncbi:MAG: caspase family protein [Verrucomicrobia bacterium]|nr:caspase family protein [Verrucomicrobiota bacterium]
MANTKILCIHGVGHAEEATASGGANSGGNPPAADWNKPWRDVITHAFTRLHAPPPQFQVVPYDSLFEQAPLNPAEYGEALAELLGSAAWHGVVGPSPTRGFDPFELGKYAGRWFAGMVVQWVVDANLRAQCRERIASAIDKFQPDIICAHSLGTLLAYDLFSYDGNGKARIKDRTFISFGSQIGNTFVTAKAWGGRIPMIPAKRWYHLFNHQDPAFTAPIQQPGQPDFTQVITDSPAGHSPTSDGHNPGYLDHPNTFSSVWTPLARPKLVPQLTRAIASVPTKISEPPRHRALIVGINAYSDPIPKLQGCINDTFLISALLQELGFPAQNIRVLSDERATKDAILDRAHWLLDGAEDGTERVLFYSGHGVQIPSYGSNQEVDHFEDGLVPVDFDWVKLNAITDQDLLNLYSQLPYNARFTAIFDCCYAGGLVRSPGLGIRVLALPPDIRHRAEKWDPRTGSWEPRPLNQFLPDLDASKRAAYVGKSGDNLKIGRAVQLRNLPNTAYDQLRELRGHKGPYLPLVVEACRADQFSYEHANGTTINGAFTFELVGEYRAAGRRRSVTTFSDLTRRVGNRLKALGYAENPQIVGPEGILKSSIVPLPPENSAGANPATKSDG